MEPSAIRDAIRKHRTEPLYQPVPIVDDATMAQVAAVTVRRLDLPGVIVERVPARRYPADGMAAHVFGYVSEATEAQLAKDGLKAGDVVGQAGFERVYNPLLMGQDGARRVVVNSVGREIRTLEEVSPIGGRRVQLTIDSDLQRAAETAFKAMGYAGAAVALDPNNGEVLAYASLPGYDPNAFVAGIDRTAWAALNSDDLKPLQDRAIQGRYSPGRRSRWRWRPPRSKRASSRPTSPSPATAGRTSTAACSSAGTRTVTARWTCATPSSSRATCTSIRSGRWSASISSTSGRRASASASAAASTCRTKSPASSRRPSGSG